MDKDIQQVLFTEQQLQARIAELGEILTRDYEGKNPVVKALCAELNGGYSVFFQNFADFTAYAVGSC